MNLVTRKVEVTAEDIQKGVQLNCDACPVHRALSRVFPEFDKIVVHEQEALVEYQGWSRKVNFPEEAEKFIRAFDRNHESVEPFSFDLGVYV